MRMIEYDGWRRIITKYGMPGAVETSTLLADLVCVVVNVLGGTADGQKFTRADVLPRFAGAKEVFTDITGKVITPTDPLAGAIQKGID